MENLMSNPNFVEVPSRIKPIATLSGFSFCPTYQELIVDHLNKRVHECTNPMNMNNIVVDCEELYGDKEPWKIFDATGIRKGEYFYVFTRLKKLTSDHSKKCKMIRRTAGLGTWHNSGKVVPIKDCKGNLLGKKRYFNFTIKDVVEHDNWTMHELCLSDEQWRPGGIVLCVVACNMMISIKNDVPVEDTQVPISNPYISCPSTNHWNARFDYAPETFYKEATPINHEIVEFSKLYGNQSFKRSSTMDQLEDEQVSSKRVCSSNIGMEQQMSDEDVFNCVATEVFGVAQEDLLWWMNSPLVT